ncbi:MAG: LysR family transcriptional regulator [Candidatus Hydrogenedentes bacterium]|nr:LysR family transcriptional regulator [Candidatus Hydrogenedentota bacterium]
MKRGLEKIAPRFKLWLESGKTASVFGDGKWRLLNAINQTGSLSAAAEKLGISYRKAWGDIRNAEGALKVKLLDRHRGGKEGGRTRLTEEGKRWLREYGRFQAAVDKAVRAGYQDWLGRMQTAREGTAGEKGA